MSTAVILPEDGSSLRRNRNGQNRYRIFGRDRRNALSVCMVPRVDFDLPVADAISEPLVPGENGVFGSHHMACEAGL
jgi:hypothetical protein